MKPFELQEFHNAVKSPEILGLITAHPHLRNTTLEKAEDFGKIYYFQHKELFLKIFEILIKKDLNPYAYFAWYLKNHDKVNSQGLDLLENVFDTDYLNEEDIQGLITASYQQMIDSKLLHMNTFLKNTQLKHDNCVNIFKKITGNSLKPPLKQQIFFMQYYQDNIGDIQNISQFVPDMLTEKEKVTSIHAVQKIITISSLEIFKSYSVDIEQIHWTLKQFFPHLKTFLSQKNLYSYFQEFCDNENYLFKIFVSSENDENLNRIEKLFDYLSHNITQEIINAFSIENESTHLKKLQDIQTYLEKIWLESDFKEKKTTVKKLKL